MRKSNLQLIFVLTWVLSLLLACTGVNAPSPTPGPTATPTVTATATASVVPTGSPVPLSQQVTLASVQTEESGQSPNYTITARTPAILDIEDPRVQTFNSLASEVVTKDINEFKATLKYVPGTPVSSGSLLDISWHQVSPPGEILSLKYDVMGYADGAAHPYHYSQSLTFNIDAGRQISLDQLFLPDSEYLQVISDYCKTELSSRDIAFDPSSGGADPTDENYRNWNINQDGLLITFDEYQVAAYAAGPQTVIVPYAALKSIIDPQGPLGKFAQ